MSAPAGRVSLVGAGPGSADLLTLRAARLLAEADVVLYDALVRSEILALAPRARRFPVGKRAGRHSVTQETIHGLLVRLARRRLHVVRLKCGDPFVLGRGGEECEALAAAGIPFEVVPGITSAVAAPGLAGIPLTHRGVATAFLVLSGHSEAALTSTLPDRPAPGLTLVVLMGFATRGPLATTLLARGFDADTRTAVCFDAATPSASTWIGALAELPSVERPDAEAAATIVIGDVVRLAPAAVFDTQRLSRRCS